MIRQPQRRLYFESETEEFYWERSRDEAEELGRRLGYSHLSWESLRNVYVGDPDESSRDSGKASDTAEVGMREGEGIE